MGLNTIFIPIILEFETELESIQVPCRPHHTQPRIKLSWPVLNSFVTRGEPQSEQLDLQLKPKIESASSFNDRHSIAGDQKSVYLPRTADQTFPSSFIHSAFSPDLSSTL